MVDKTNGRNGTGDQEPKANRYLRSSKARTYGFVIGRANAVAEDCLAGTLEKDVVHNFVKAEKNTQNWIKSRAQYGAPKEGETDTALQMVDPDDNNADKKQTDTIQAELDAIEAEEMALKERRANLLAGNGLRAK